MPITCHKFPKMRKRSLIQQCENVRAAANPLFIELCELLTVAISSVRPFVVLDLSHGGKPPHRQPSQLLLSYIDIIVLQSIPYTAIDYCIYNIICHTHTILCAKVLHYHTLCRPKVRKYCEKAIFKAKVKKHLDKKAKLW